MSKIRFAVAGTGHIGKRHVEVIMQNPHAELAAVIDPVVTQWPAVDMPRFSVLTDFLASGIAADVVNICTPNGLHAPLAIECLQAGKHVVIEKPMALSRVQCEQVIHAAKEAKKEVFIVKQNRFSPPVKWLKFMMTEKRLGRVLMVQVNCFWNRDERYYTPGSWKGSPDLDGGPLFTQFSHFIDLLYWVFGDITDIQSRFNNYTHPGLAPMEDSGSVMFNLVQGGQGVVNFTTSVYGKNMESSVTVIGEKGTIKLGGQYMNQVEYCEVKDYAMPELETTAPPNNYGPYTGSAANHQYVIQNVIDTLAGRTSASTNATEGMTVVDMIERMIGAGRHK